MESNLYSQNNPNSENEFFKSFDLERFWRVLKRSKFWLIFIIILPMMLAYLYVRYTKPVYNSESIIKLEFENEANVLRFGGAGLNGQKRDEILGEIELIKSKLFLSRVAEVIKQDVSYYVYGRYLIDERYGNSPFIVSFKIKNLAFHDRPFDVEFEDENSFVLSYTNNGIDVSKTYSFGQEITTEDFNLYVEKTKYFYPDNNRYFFVVKSREELVDNLQENLEVFPKNLHAKTIVISYLDYNSRKASDMVNLIDSLYLSYTQEVKNLAIEQKIDFLETQIENTEKTISEYENYFEQFTIDNRTISLDQDLKKTIEQLYELDSQHYTLKKNIKDIELTQKQVSEKNAVVLNPLFLERLPKLIEETIIDYSDLQQQRELKLSSYNETSFIIEKLDIQLNELKKILTDQLSSYNKSLDDRLSFTEKRRRRLEGDLLKIPSMGTEHDKNRRLYSLQKEFMLSLQTSKIELEIIRAGTVSRNIILSSASLPVSPIKPQKALIIGLSFVIGLVLNIIYVLIRYVSDNKIAGLNELERLTNIPILGTIPHINKKYLRYFFPIVKQDSKSFLSESFRIIRTNMGYINPKKKLKLISVTSTISGEGKTFIATNLGAIMAMAGKKVLIVDIDMRKPKVHLAFDGNKQNGVSTILSGGSVIKESIQKTTIGGLSFISAGPIPPNPSELLLQNEFKDMLEELSKDFDTVILDTPPIDFVTDGTLVMKYCDIQLYVIRVGYSKKRFVKILNNLKSKDQFSNLTTILNSTSSLFGKYGDGYYADDK